MVLPTGAVTRTFTHTFPDAGAHTVKATFADDEGLSASVSWAVTAVDPITIQLDAANYTVNEDDGEVEITVSISASPPESVSVEFQTLNGTANLGDYLRKTVVVSFPKDATTLAQTVPVTIIDCPAVESAEETFTVTFRTLFGCLPAYVGLTRSEATVTIADDDEVTVGSISHTRLVGGGHAPASHDKFDDTGRAPRSDSPTREVYPIRHE